MRDFTVVVRLGVVLVLAVLIGCGGGGGGAASSPSPDDGASPNGTVAEGRFIDSPVSGITYICGDITGTTDENGIFIYYVGEEVTFLIGDVVLGTAPGAAIVTPVNLVKDAEDETNPVVINLLRFIQSMDDDGNPGNGIVISEEIQRLMIRIDIDFEQTMAAFENDPGLAALLAVLPHYTDGSIRMLITEEAALAHFQNHQNGNEPSHGAHFFEDAEVTGNMTAGDFNGDGIDDLVFTVRTTPGYSMGSDLSMFRIAYGNSAGDISDTEDVFCYGGGSTGKTRNNIVVGDFNGDGIDDFAFSGDILQIYTGSSSGPPQELYLSSDFFGPNLYVIDIDHNGTQDFLSIVMDDYANMFSIVRNNGDGTFEDKEYLGFYGSPEWHGLIGGTPLNAVVADFNGDGLSDILTLVAGTNRYNDMTFEHIVIAVWPGNGNGTLDYPTAYHLLSDDLFIGTYYFDEDYKKMATGDIDQDGDQDIVMTSSTNFLQILLNDGTGNFTGNGRAGVGQAPSNIGIGDFNQDGYPDIASINQDSKELVISFGNGDGTFGEKEEAVSIVLDPKVELYDMVVLDYNNDGVPDIAFAEDGINRPGSGRGSVQVFLSPGLSMSTSN